MLAPAEFALVLRRPARSESPPPSVEPTVKVVAAPETTGSGVSVAVAITGVALVTVNVPVSDVAEQVLAPSHANA